MSLLKSIERLKRIDYFLKKEATGTGDEFAEKIGISRSTLMENLREMKKFNFNKKLSLNKETLVSLYKSQMANAKGGFLSIISCRTNAGNDGCSHCIGCNTRQ